MRHTAAVLVDQHEHGAEHHLTAVLGGSAGAQFLADADFGDVADADRCAANAADDDIGDVIDSAHLARCTDQQLLATALDVAGANVAVVAFQGSQQIIQGQLVGSQALGIGRNLVLLGVAANGVDFGNPGHVAQLRLDDPVLDHPQVGRGVGRTVFLQRARLGLDGPQENLAEPGRYRAHDRLDALRQLRLGHLQTLVDQLPGEEDVGAVLENHRDLRQARARQRAGLQQPRQAGHGRFHGKGDALLGFQR